jgi:hypothetical protein
MPLDPNATDIQGIKLAFVRFVRDHIFGGEELALLEPFNGQRPAKTYCAIRFISANPEMHEVYDYDWNYETDRPDQFLRGERYCKIRVTFFGVGANQLAVDTQNLFRSYHAQFSIMPITGFGFVGEVQDVTTENMAWQEERATFLVEVYANLSAKYEANNIENMPGDINRDPVSLGGADACKLPPK